MATSSIEWTGKVWNPTTGCNKVSPGCKNCYAEKMHKRLAGMGQEKYQRPFLAGAFEHDASLSVPLGWKKGTTIFVDSMSDLFHEGISLEYIAKVYAIMFLTPQHTYQVLTKRPEQRYDVFKSPEFFEYLHMYCNQFHDRFINKLEQELYFFAEVKSEFPFKNVWEGTSCENQATANQRIPILAETPAKIRWISAEPLLEQIDLKKIPEALVLNWIVVGGESGPKKRPFDLNWARTIRDYCKESDIKFFMKQVDKVREIPSTLMIREYPTA